MYIVDDYRIKLQKYHKAFKSKNVLKFVSIIILIFIIEIIPTFIHVDDQKVDIFILELGANDGLRGIPLKETRKNLQAIIDAVLAKNAATKIVLAGMQLPPNMGIDYITEFKTIFPELAKKNGLKLIPFLLKDVGGIPALNQADGIHPTGKGHKILANNAWVILKPMLTS